MGYRSGLHPSINSHEFSNEAPEDFVRQLPSKKLQPDFVEGLGEVSVGGEDKPVGLFTDKTDEYDSSRVPFEFTGTLGEQGSATLTTAKIPESLQITSEALRGGFKADQGKSRMGLIPPQELLELGDLFALGANKYSDYNWMLGMDYHRIYDALQRHATKWWAGEEKDAVDGQHHLVSVAWCALTLLHFANNPERYKDFDDRPHTWTDDKIKAGLKTTAKV